MWLDQAKRKRPTQSTAHFFLIKNNLILAARGKHNTKDIALPEINTAAGVLVTGHFSFGRPAALFARENGLLC
jgi:hypothetical protein